VRQGRAATQPARPREEKRPAGDAAVGQKARDDERVTPVVAGTAQEEDAPLGQTVTMECAEEGGYLAPGLLHQDNFGNAVPFDRPSIDSPHLVV